MPDPVGLLKVNSYDQPGLKNNVFRLLDAVLPAPSGLKILVKPNLLMAHGLACTNPEVVANACEWLLLKGAKVQVCDSPAFGTAESVAKAIGLQKALAPLGLKAASFSRPVETGITFGDAAKKIRLGREALECDAILSIPRIKAHSQVRMTLAVKNCFGCIMGIRKAIAHVRFGRDVNYFADCVAALYARLPVVWALCDGITAMSVTGPRNGEPFQAGIMAASISPPALDAAILAILKIDQALVPLCGALARCNISQEAGGWPLATPDDFNITGFQAPARLKDVSFNPVQLARSILKRLWLDLGGRR